MDSNNTLKTERWAPGIYRVSNSRFYGHVSRHDRDETGRHTKIQWFADIHDARTGTLVQYAGIWNTKREAIEECTHTLSAPEFRQIDD